jgi:hypothetical protein
LVNLVHHITPQPDPFSHSLKRLQRFTFMVAPKALVRYLVMFGNLISPVGSGRCCLDHHLQTQQCHMAHSSNTLLLQALDLGMEWLSGNSMEYCMGLEVRVMLQFLRTFGALTALNTIGRGLMVLQLQE